MQPARCTRTRARRVSDTHALVLWQWFGFRVVDDVHFGGSWAPAGNAAANNLTAQGWPWFGDEMELLVDARPSATAGAGAGGSNVVGNASQWQMVCNTVKSRLGGWGVGGLMEGEPRNDGGKAWGRDLR